MFSQLIQAVLLTWHSTYEDKALSLLVEIFRFSKNAKFHGLLQLLVLGFRRGKKLWDRNAKRSGHVPPMQCHAFVESMPFWVYRVSWCSDLGAIQIRATGTSYVLFWSKSIVSFLPVCPAVLQCFNRGISSNCVWAVQHVSIFWLHSESKVNQWWDIRHFSCFAAKAACRSWIAHCCCAHGVVGSSGAQWCSFCGWQKLTAVLLSIFFFFFQCFHCASVQFQLQYPGTLPRKYAGGTGWNGWRQSDWHLGVMPCRALSCFLLRSSLGTEGIWLWDDLQRKCSLGWGPLRLET